MSTAAPLPQAGVYPVEIPWGPLDSRKRTRDEFELYSLKYGFKPASMASFDSGTIHSADSSGSKQLKVKTQSHGEQVFDVREEDNKSRECVLIYDETNHTFQLQALPHTIHLTLNRAVSSRGAAGQAPSEASSASSTSAPLAETTARQEQVDAEGDEDKSIEEASERALQAPPLKRPRPSETIARPTKGGKGVPRKALPAHAPIPTAAPAAAKGKGRGKANPKKGAAGKAKGGASKPKPPPTPTGKYKSSEIIEDSDEEAGDDADEEEDEFAKMMGESLAQAEDLDDEDEEEEEESEDEQLGGAKLLVRHQGASSAVDDGETEWL